MISVLRFAKLLLALSLAGAALGPLPDAPARVVPQAPPGDPPLTDAQVTRWFNASLTRGDGTRCEVRPGNDVLELIDARETFAAMTAAIKTASAPVENPEAALPTLFVMRHFGTSPTDPIWAKELGLLAEGKDGNLYGASPSGGKNGRGAAYRITPDGKTLTVLHDFAFPTGANPLGGLSAGSDGSFYGTTYEGGKYGGGVLFRLSPAGQYTVLWDFRNGTIVPPPVYPKQPTEQQKLDAAGSYPLSPPILGRDGRLYGVTAHANNQQYGALYTGALQGLYFFRGENGKFPIGLVAASDGNLYGTTLKGDASCPYGTVFKATTSGQVSTLHRFDFTRGAGSYHILQGSDGNLYGTASSGGTGALKAGVVFRLTLKGEYRVLHDFSGGADGSTPTAGLVQAKDGYLYGLTRGGGTGGRGVLFRVRPDGENFRVLYHFPYNWSMGRIPMATPILHRDGRLYGTTYQGGSNDKGVLYRVEIPRFVYLLGWWLTDSLPLIPGDATSTVQALFQDASQKDVQVRAMLWDQPLTQNTAEVERINGLAQGAAILDNRTLDLGSHHQKILLIGGSEGLIAFCGGVDINPDRMFPLGAGPNAAGDTQGAPLHDVHCRIQGPAVGDLLSVFTQRWNDHPDHASLDRAKGALRGSSTLLFDPRPGATHWIQVGRTYGNGIRNKGIDAVIRKGYAFAPNGEQSAGRMILHAIQQTKRFLYVEDQYFVNTGPNLAGLDIRQALINKLKEPGFQHLTILIPHGSITSMGPPLLPNQVDYRRRELIDALKAAPGGNKVRLFYLSPPGNAHTYVHSKTWIFDDEFAIIGSANTNRRSWTHDSEVVVGICDQGKAGSPEMRTPRRLRVRLWMHHLGLADTPANRERLRDGVASADAWLSPPPGAHIARYDTIDPQPPPSDINWRGTIDPDGS